MVTKHNATAAYACTLKVSSCCSTTDVFFRFVSSVASLSGVTLQCEWCGLRANNATVYAEGVLLCHLSEFGDFVCITRLYFGDFPCHLPFGCKENDTEGVPVHFY